MLLRGLTDAEPAPATSLPSLQLSRDIAAIVDGLTAAPRSDRRNTRRIPLPFLFELRPVADDFDGAATGPTVVVGKDLSDRGIGFFHQFPIPHRRVRLRLELEDLDPFELEVEILWCRFTRQGWYESGGRILDIEGNPPCLPPPPLERSPLWELP